MPKNFFDIDGQKQCEIMVGLLQRFADSGVPFLEALSEKEGSTPQAVWEDVCRASGIEPCPVPDFLLTQKHV